MISTGEVSEDFKELTFELDLEIEGGIEQGRGFLAEKEHE